MTEKLWRIAEPVCTDAGYELVDMTLVQSRRGWVLRVFIDHMEEMVDGNMVAGIGGETTGNDARGQLVEHSTIGLGDCERVSRELGVALDVEDPIEQAYELEVSSPGLDRPLRTRAHFLRHVGSEVKISLHDGVNGRRNFKGQLMAMSRMSPAAAGAESGDATGDPAGDVVPDQSSATEPSATEVVVVRVDGVDHELPFHDIARAQIVPDWNALFNASQRQLQKGSSTPGPKAGRAGGSKATPMKKAASAGPEGSG